MPRGEAADLKSPGMGGLLQPGPAQDSRDFRLRAVEPPDGYTQFFEKIVLVEKLREVRALVGFTRIESPRDFDTPLELPPEQRAPLSRAEPDVGAGLRDPGRGHLLPVLRGGDPEVGGRSHGRTTRSSSRPTGGGGPRRISTPSWAIPGIRYVLLHTFAHALIRQLAVECGYTTASIAERIYSRSPDDGEPMAGVLIYTAAPDSEGTLGGLCALGSPSAGRHLDQALEQIGLCASDPLCAEHSPSKDVTLHGAACHACSFLPETSCERGNKYLDRSVLVATVERAIWPSSR